MRFLALLVLLQSVSSIPAIGPTVSYEATITSTTLQQSTTEAVTETTTVAIATTSTTSSTTTSQTTPVFTPPVQQKVQKKTVVQPPPNNSPINPSAPAALVNSAPPPQDPAPVKDTVPSSASPPSASPEVTQPPSIPVNVNAAVNNGGTPSSAPGLSSSNRNTIIGLALAGLLGIVAAIFLTNLSKKRKVKEQFPKAFSIADNKSVTTRSLHSASPIEQEQQEYYVYATTPQPPVFALTAQEYYSSPLPPSLGGSMIIEEFPRDGLMMNNTLDTDLLQIPNNVLSTPPKDRVQSKQSDISDIVNDYNRKSGNTNSIYSEAQRFKSMYSEVPSEYQSPNSLFFSPISGGSSVRDSYGGDSVLSYGDVEVEGNNEN